VHADDLLDQCGCFGFAVREDVVSLVGSSTGPVWWKHDGFESEKREKLFGRRFGGGGHPGQVRVLTDEVLHRNGSEDAALRPDFDTFLRFDGRLDAVGPAAILRHAARPFVHELDDAVADDVVAIATKQRVGVKCDVDRAQQQMLRGIVEVHVQPRASVLEAGLCQHDRALVFVGVVVDARPEIANERRERTMIDRKRWRRPRDHQRHPCLVNQDEICLVDDGEMVASMHDQRRIHRRMVAEKVEAGFPCGDIRDVCGVGAASLLMRHALGDARDLEAEELVERRHPLRVAAGEVIVGREDVDARAVQRVQRSGSNGGERFSFARRKLNETALVQCDSRGELNVERPHVEDTCRGLAGDREHLGHQSGERLAVSRTTTHRGRSSAQFGIRRAADVQRVDPLDRFEVRTDVVLDGVTGG
jgi:hypothetical protein